MRKRINGGQVRMSAESRRTQMTAIHFDGAREHVAGIGRRSLGQRVRDTVSAAFEALPAWHRRARDRSQLLTLDKRMLADIGITRAEAEYLGNKPFWRE
jgi:uncharacterized protein YjiS (DUF1127 family)